MAANLIVFGIAAMWLVAVLLTAPGLRRIVVAAFTHPFRDPEPGSGDPGRRLKVAVLTICLITIAAVAGAWLLAGVHKPSDLVKNATRGLLAVAILGIGGLLGLLGGRRYYQRTAEPAVPEPDPR